MGRGARAREFAGLSLAGETELSTLCRMVEAKVRARGHELGRWATPEGEVETARRAACVRCGAVVHVRRERDLMGTAGSALTDRCAS